MFVRQFTIHELLSCKAVYTKRPSMYFRLTLKDKIVDETRLARVKKIFVFVLVPNSQ